MVTFRLIEEDEQKIIYWYFPEGKEDKGHGVIIVDKVQEEIDITEVAPDDFERDIPAEELNELAEAINQMKREAREGRYAVNNKHYPRTGSDPVERWVCNYFHEKPENFDIYRMEAGHNDPFDPTKSCEENNNMYNVSWQTSKENKSDHKKFEKGGYEKVIYENSHLKKEDVTYADWLKKNLTALSDPNISTFVKIERTGKIREDGTRFIKEFSFTQKH